MIEKTCLIVDDEAAYQKRVFETSVANNLRPKGINVNLILVDTTDKDLQTDEKIDLKKIKLYIEDKIKNLKLDVVACDYELSSRDVNGIDVIREIRALRPKTKIFLYSGKYEKVIGDIVKEIQKGDQQSINSGIQAIKNIYSSRIEEFLERNDYSTRLVGVLQNNNDSIDDIFIKKIREYSELRFKSCYPIFEGKTLGEITEEIEKETHSSQKFLEELVEQTVAYLIKTNQDE
ncbi:MAG: hypothetical protein HXX16_04155 [Bacteroidales bacterium]|nr:hypothetical protein [Bacteroidales bacterium]